MHNIIRHIFLLSIVLILTGCVCCSNTKITPINENWICQLKHSASDWTQGADSWFVTGRGHHKADANSLMKIRVPNFDKIVVNGNFTVQIVGAQHQNSVAISGPYACARQVLINIRNGTLYITPPKDKHMNLQNVIVRVGVHNLKCLTNLGCGNIYGRGVLSNGLYIYSAGSGNTLLMGNMNVQQVNQLGPGTITVFGANTPSLAIQVIGNGNVNLCGRVGAQSIVHRGNGKIDIIGLDSDDLTIYASGAGITQAVGVANLRKVSAYNNSRVYLYWVNSENTTVIERDYAHVGLAGTTTTLTVDTKDSSQFEGQYLFARRAYATTHESSHANVNATQLLFLEGKDHSSIYYFSTVKEQSTFAADQSIILQTHSSCACALAMPMMRKYKN